MAAGGFFIRLIGIEALERKLEGSEKAEEPIQRFLDLSATYFTNEAKIAMTNSRAIDTGDTRKSIGVLASDDRTREVGPNTTYAPFIEFGRKPGKMPPPGALLPWMGRNRIPAEAEYAIGRAIAMNGIAERPFMRPAAEATAQYMKDLLPGFAAEIEASYAEGI